MANNLMARARAIVVSGSGAALALAITPISSSAAEQTWDIQESFVEVVRTSAPDQFGNTQWQSTSLPSAFVNADLINGGSVVRVSGHLGPVSGAGWSSEIGDETVIFNFSSGGYLMPILAGDQFVSSFNFGVVSTGGLVSWTLSYEAFGQNGPIEIFPTTRHGSAGPGSHHFDGFVGLGVFQNDHLSIPNTWSGGADVMLAVKWEGYSPGDTFELTIPNNSIDIGLNQVSAVPWPRTAPMFFAGLLVLFPFVTKTKYRVRYSGLL